MDSDNKESTTFQTAAPKIATPRTATPNTGPSKTTLSRAGPTKAPSRITMTPNTSVPQNNALSERTFIKFSQSEESLLAELEIENRRWYIAGLSRENFTVPATQVFQDMETNNPVFLAAIRKTKRDFKNFRAQTTRNIATHVQRFLNSTADEVAQITDFKELTRAINDVFEPNWLPQIFTFAVPACSFDDISILGRQFLRCRYACPSNTLFNAYIDSFS